MMNVVEVRSAAQSRPRFAVYACLLIFFAGAILGVLELGRNLHSQSPAVVHSAVASHRASGPDWPRMLLQVVVIIAASRAFGWAMRWLRQPQVVGETIAGIVLGPSLLGWIAPGASSFLFPANSLNLLGALSQIGLTLFMFLVGLELDLSALRSKSHTAVMTSHVSIIFPFFLGSLLSLKLYAPLAPPNVPFSHFALFVGISMSITAFPVLARILAERGMLKTPIGSITIACAAIDDITAWCLLACVVALVRADAALPVWVTLGGSAVFCALMVFAVRRVLSNISQRRQPSGSIGEGTMAVLFLLLLTSAWITESLGIHALFGSFLVGAIIPRNQALIGEVQKMVSHLTIVLLLPIFFALTGLRTNVAGLGDGYLWIYGVAILVAAVVGKFGGSLLSARFSGSSWHEAATLGVLMNTRGLMELVVLNIGYDIGILSRPLFTMMVLMAVFTTMMTSPLLDLLTSLQARTRREPNAAEHSRT